MAEEPPKRSSLKSRLGGIGLLLFVTFRLVMSGIPLIYLVGLFAAGLVGVCLFYSRWFQKWQEEQTQISSFVEEHYGQICRIEAKIERRIRRICRYKLFEIHPIGTDGKTTAILFFKKDADIANANIAGIPDKVLNVIYEEIENAGCGTREKVTVEFQLDSYENVDKNWGGNIRARIG